MFLYFLSGYLIELISVHYIHVGELESLMG